MLVMTLLSRRLSLFLVILMFSLYLFTVFFTVQFFLFLIPLPVVPAYKLVSFFILVVLHSNLLSTLFTHVLNRSYRQ